ncbi:MAG: magnesium transporter [Anaerolineales bacterium]
MQEATIDQIIEQLRADLERDDYQSAIATLLGLRTPDQADVVGELEAAQQTALLPKLAVADSADILEELDDIDAADLFQSLPTEAAVRILEEMEPDEAADLLGDMPPEVAAHILTALEDPEEIHPLLLHPDETAGGLMTSEFLALRRRMTAAEGLQAIHRWKPERETITSLFVVDRSGRLVGEVSLRQLIVAAPTMEIAEFMRTDVLTVSAAADQEECARLMTRYDLLSLPVVDTGNVLIGVITIDDVFDVIENEATEDIQRLGGAQPLDQPYLRTGVPSIVRKRIGWLLLLFVTESLTGTVLRHFEGELQQAVALAFFVPLLIGTGGNAGSQTTSTLIRALAVGDIDLGDAVRALWHELRIGLLLGLGMGVVAFVRALTWGSEPQLALTVAVSIFTIVIWANGLGSMLPLLAARLKIDPTVVSGPVMSTLVDATGLFIYFSLAGILLGR